MNSDLPQRTALEILAHQNTLAEAVVNEVYELRPELEARYGSAGRARCLQDTLYHLKYLAEAVAVESPLLFADYLSWAKVLLAAYRIPVRDLEDNIRITAEVLTRQLPAASGPLVQSYVQNGLSKLSDAPDVPPSFITESNPHAAEAREYLEILLKGNRYRASEIVTDLIKNGVHARDVYLNIFAPTQYEIGRLWQMGQLSVAQEHFCTAATQLIMSRLYPVIFNSPKNGRKIVAASVAGELHEIGVRMVADFLEMEGWDTFYVGANTPANSLVKMIEQHQADLLGVSATMTFHISAVKTLIAEVRKSTIGNRVKILVGGYPFNLDAELWKKVGADACAGSIKDIHRVAAELLK